MKICICQCQFYHRVPEETVQAVKAACQAAGVECIMVPDCGAAAKDRAMMQTLSGCEMVLACQERAVKALFGELPAPQCLDLRKLTVAEVCKILSVNAVPSPEVISEVVPSQWVPWFPVIDRLRCVNCGKCADFCLFGVYAKADGMVQVVKPEGCKTDCPACARICPRNAIVFPKCGEARLNGELKEAVLPTEADHAALRERLKARRAPRLFKEDPE